MQASPCQKSCIDFNRPIHTRPSNSSSAWKVKRALWRGRFRVRPAEPVSVPRYKRSVKRNHFWPRIFWPKFYPATSKNGDKATLASPVPSPPKTMFSRLSFALSQKKNCLTWQKGRAHYGGPSKAKPFFPTTCGPKNSPATLDRNAPAMFKNEERRCRTTPCPPSTMLLEAAATKPPPTSEQPIRMHNTEIRRGAGRPVIQSDLHYNVCPSLLKHCLIVIQSVQAREYFQNQAMVANFILLDMKLMKNGPSRIWKWCLGKMWKRLDHD